MKKYIAILIMFAFTMPAMAEENQRSIDKLREARQELKDAKQEARKEVKEIRKETRQDVRTNAEAIKKEVKMNREEAKKDLKAKLLKIKDVKKKKIVEKLGTDITELNKRITDQYLKNLGKMTEILNRINSRADNAISKGIDVIAVKDAIVKAESSITSTTELINAQATKGYSFDLADESNLKAKVGEARQAFRDDLKTVQKAMSDSREAVRAAAKALAGTPRIKEIPEIMPAATTTNTVNQ
ncbi:MAG: hypothetical protein HZA95_00925 [Candidatus Vogelbacteria bacterium]|nr:hypothetical protein [Candidatus Vogelbacteria bacterium]